MPRELVILGTASQAPTRERNHNGYLLRWDDIGLLFDPGEGTQRQMLHAGVRTSMITDVLITHQHGDHCLGLPGVLQRMALEQRVDPVRVVYPAQARPFIHRLVGVGLFESPLTVEHIEVPPEGMELAVGDHIVQALPLDHRVPAVGYRLQEPPRRRFDPAALRAAGVEGPAVGRLQSAGWLALDGKTVTLEEVSSVIRGQAMAFVMDTRPCGTASDLLADADLGVVESTYQDGDEELAVRFGHMTAAQAGLLAASAGVRRLVVTHFSQRYGDVSGFAEQAGRHHPDVVAAVDLQRVPVPPRRPVPAEKAAGAPVEAGARAVHDG